MKVVKSTGLAPVRFARSVLPYQAGEVCGLAPDMARKHILAGDAVAVTPEGVELVDVPDPDVKSTAAKEKQVEEKLPLPNTVVIPDDWDDMHHLKIVKLAAALIGVEKLDPPPEMKAVDYARETIRTAIENRKKTGGQVPAEKVDPAKAGGKDAKATDEKTSGGSATPGTGDPTPA